MNRPIRILHTADWHLGKDLKGKDRTPEIVQALEAIAELAVERKVDLVLATGDLLDHPQPSSAAEGALVDFVLRLHKEGIACFLIAGNHDPGERFERVYRPLLEGKAEVRGRLALADEGGLVEFHGLRFALVPFVPERRLVKTLEDKGEERRAAYGERMGRLLAHFGADVVLGHFPVAGSRPGGGEFALYLADTYAVPPGMLPSARYIALGHLHRMQEVAPQAWYPGSPIALDFSGEEADRGVLYVEIPGERHLPPRVEPIKAQWGKPLRTFRFKAAEAWKGMEEVEAFVGWARVVLEGTPEPSLRDAFRALDHVLEVAVAEADHGPGSSAEEEVPAALEEAYARYLEEEEKDEKKRAELLRSFGELRQEVRDAAFKAGT